MVILDGNLPIKWLAMFVRRSNAPLDERDALLALPVSIGTGVERVLQYRDDVAVADRSPIKVHERFAVRRTREMHLLGGQRDQHLLSAAQLTETREHDADCLLRSQVRLESEPDLPMPRISDGHTDTQVTAQSFAVLGIQHARPDHIEFELTDAALHAEQQVVVRSMRIVVAVGIYDPRADEATQLEKVMPIVGAGLKLSHRADSTLSQG